MAVEPDILDGGIGAGVAADKAAGRRIDASPLARKRTGIIPAMAVTGGDATGRDAPKLFMFPDQCGKIGFGGGIGMFAAVVRRGLDDENGFVSDNAADLVVFAVAGLDGFAAGENATVAFAGPAQVRSGILQKGDQARFIVGRGLGHGKEAGRLRPGQGTDHRPVRFAEAPDAGGSEGDGFGLGIQPDIESAREDLGEVVVSLQNVKSRAGGAGNGLFVLVEDGRDDGAKLAQAGEEFFFEIARLRGEILDAQVHEVPLPESGRAPAPDDGSALEDAHADARSLQGLSAAKPGKAGSNDRNRARVFHRGNVTISIPGAITITSVARQACSILR